MWAARSASISGDLLQIATVDLSPVAAAHPARHAPARLQRGRPIRAESISASPVFAQEGLIVLPHRACVMGVDDPAPREPFASAG
jgi:hypothetical protein